MTATGWIGRRGGLYLLAGSRLPSALAVLLALVASPAAGHEFWLMPETFEPRPGVPFGIRLFVGDGFDKGRPYARNPRHVREFKAVAGTERPIDGRPGDDPAGSFAAEGPGVVALVYRSSFSSLTLEADRFERYLKAEGLEHISRLRAEAGESGEPGREAFARCAKSLVRVGGAGPEGFDRRVGLELEIVPLRAPFNLEPDRPLPILVLWKGEPLAGARVRAFVRGRPELTAAIRTGEDGRADVELAAPGVWLLSVVHMARAESGADVDWRSTWSSLTFESVEARGEAYPSNPSS